MNGRNAQFQRKMSRNIVMNQSPMPTGYVSFYVSQSIKIILCQFRLKFQKIQLESKSFQMFQKVSKNFKPFLDRDNGSNGSTDNCFAKYSIHLDNWASAQLHSRSSAPCRSTWNLSRFFEIDLYQKWHVERGSIKWKKWLPLQICPSRKGKARVSLSFQRIQKASKWFRAKFRFLDQGRVQHWSINDRWDGSNCNRLHGLCQEQVPPWHKMQILPPRSSPNCKLGSSVQISRFLERN